VRRLKSASGISLLEVALAIILAFCCLLPVLAKQTTWLHSTRLAIHALSDFFDLFDPKSPNLERNCLTSSLPGQINLISCQVHNGLTNKELKYSILAN
jgi:hypothetical protein